MEKGRELFEKHNILLTYKFRMKYGTGNVLIMPNWKEREDEHKKENNPQTDLRFFSDYKILQKDRIRMWEYVSEIVNKTTLQDELHENDMFLMVRTTIWGNPTNPMPLSESNLDYGEYIELN